MKYFLNRILILILLLVAWILVLNYWIFPEPQPVVLTPAVTPMTQNTQTTTPVIKEVPVKTVTKPVPVVKKIEKPGEVMGTEITSENIFNGVNRERYLAGLPILKRNAKLDAIAQTKLNDMVAKGYWAHTNPEGKRFQDFILDGGYDYSYAGENLATNYATVQETVAAWMASPDHKENILKPQYKETGIAVYNSLVVQEFGSQE